DGWHWGYRRRRNGWHWNGWHWRYRRHRNGWHWRYRNRRRGRYRRRWNRGGGGGGGDRRRRGQRRRRGHFGSVVDGVLRDVAGEPVSDRRDRMVGAHAHRRCILFAGSRRQS